MCRINGTKINLARLQNERAMYNKHCFGSTSRMINTTKILILHKNNENTSQNNQNPSFFTTLAINQRLTTLGRAFIQESLLNCGKNDKFLVS